MIVLVIQISEFLNSGIRIRIRIWNPHLECGFLIRIQETEIMRVCSDADPQYCVHCSVTFTAKDDFP